MINKYTFNIDAAFSLYRSHFRLFIKSVLIYFSVDALREALLLLLWRHQVYLYLDEVTHNLLETLAIGLLIVIASEIYSGRQITLTQAYRRYSNLFPRYFTTSVVYLIPYSLWSLLIALNEPPYPVISFLVLVGLPFAFYFLIAWILYGPVVIVERSVVQHPLKRSRKLFTGNRWQLCAKIIAILVLIFAIEMIFSFSVLFIAKASGLFGDTTWGETIQSMIQDYFVQKGFTSLSLYRVISLFIDTGIMHSRYEFTLSV